MGKAATKESPANKQAEDVPKWCKTLFVKNLPYDASEAEIADIFGTKGVSGVRVVTERGRSKGFAFVDFRDHQSAKAAAELGAKGVSLKGRGLRVDFDTGQPRAGFHYREEAYDSKFRPRKFDGGGMGKSGGKGAGKDRR